MWSGESAETFSLFEKLARLSSCDLRICISQLPVTLSFIPPAFISRYFNVLKAPVTRVNLLVRAALIAQTNKRRAVIQRSQTDELVVNNRPQFALLRVPVQGEICTSSQRISQYLVETFVAEWGERAGITESDHNNATTVTLSVPPCMNKIGDSSLSKPLVCLELKERAAVPVLSDSCSADRGCRCMPGYNVPGPKHLMYVHDDTNVYMKDKLSLLANQTWTKKANPGNVIPGTDLERGNTSLIRGAFEVVGSENDSWRIRRSCSTVGYCAVTRAAGWPHSRDFCDLVQTTFPLCWASRA
ncbi:hypothetical protein JOB18_019507 [Solea senegalensis]|uniref:Uncharacterized protein n=1 Tax=Solea senegalensis TaxID=28829 RepID=A0AAV6SKN2_SOLSE|nr:hypothetical protein JOB18_019507 [Solea senegalensis]